MHQLCGKKVAGRLLVDNVEKFSTTIVEKQAQISRSRLMWKTLPPGLWKNGRLEDRFVDDVEKLSTAIVNKSAVRLVAVDGVEKLSTAIVENSTGVLKRKKR